MGIPTANELLMGAGSRAATFPQIGATVTGEIITEPQVQQQTDLDTGEPKAFANGDPMLQIIVVLQTGEREDVDDDGKRTLYIKANMQKAIKEAVTAAKASGLEKGGTLAVQYSSDGEPKKRGFNAPKFYRAAYQPPANPANALLGLTSPQPGAPNAAATGAGTPPSPPPLPPAPPAAPLLPTPAAPTVPTLTPSTPAPTGMDPDVWARLTPAQQSALSGTPASTVPF